MTVFYIFAGAALTILVAALIGFLLASWWFDGPAVPPNGVWRRAKQSWTPTEGDGIKPLKVGGATDVAGRDGRQGPPDSGPEGDSGRFASAHVLPMVQQQIELQALLDAARYSSLPDHAPVMIFPHQMDADGREIRN